MHTTYVSSISDILRSLPPSGMQREVRLQRATEMYALGRALEAVRAAAARMRQEPGATPASAPAPETADVLTRILSAAVTLCRTSDPVVHPGDFEAREQLRKGIASPAFVALVPGWIAELRQIASIYPGTGACTVATAMQLWLWTVRHFEGAPSRREPVLGELAEAFCPLLGARFQIVELADAGVKPGAGGQPAHFLADLSHAHAAAAAGRVATLCAEVVFGYRTHPAWDAEGCASCYGAADLDELEGLMPGIASSARAHSDVIEADGSHPAKAGPCARATGLEEFVRLRAKLDGCLTGARLALERATAALPAILGEGSSTVR